MNTYTDKTQEKKSKSVANAASRKQSVEESTFQFVDNRPEAMQMQELREMMDNSPQANKLRAFQDMANNSPRAMQLKALQETANNSPQAKQAVQLQLMVDNHSAQKQQPTQKKENNTGLPDSLKTGMESLSGFNLDHVKVHYNSPKPAAVQAHAYAQGADIHLASGQEKLLPHELGHVVQQAQDRVKPTTSINGMTVNDNAGLEREADVMGAKALQMKRDVEETKENKNRAVADSVTQREGKGFRLVDNRPEAIVQRKLHEITKNGTQVYQLQTFSNKRTDTSNKSTMQLCGDPKESGQKVKDKTVLNEVARAQLNPRLRNFYLSIPASQSRSIFGFHTYGLNPFAIPYSLISNWKSLDVTIPYLRAFGTLNRALNKYTDTSPGALVSKDEMNNFRWNMLAFGDGMIKRMLIQTIAMQGIRNPRLRCLMIGANILLQGGGQVLLKDKQIRKAAQEQNLTSEDLDTATNVLRNQYVIDLFGKPKED